MGFGLAKSGLYLPSNLQEQILTIAADFQQTYFNLIGHSVNHWYREHQGFNTFAENALEDIHKVREIQRISGRLALEELAGQTMGVGDVLALRLQNFGVNPNRVHNDIEMAVEDIVSGRFSRMCTGTRKLGYWSGFSRAITY